MIGYECNLIFFVLTWNFGFPPLSRRNARVGLADRTGCPVKDVFFSSIAGIMVPKNDKIKVQPAKFTGKRKSLNHFLYKKVNFGLVKIICKF